MDLEKIFGLGKAENADVEVFYQSMDFTTLNIEKHRVHSMDSGKIAGVGIRVVKDGKVGFAYTTELSNSGLESCLREALETSKTAKVLKNFSLPREKEYSEFNLKVSKKIEGLSVEEAKELVNIMLDGVKSVHRDIFACEGHFSYGIERTLIANSYGVWAEYSRSASVLALMTAFPQADGVSVGFEEIESPELDFDFGEIGKNAGNLAFKGRNPEKLESGKRNVFLIPTAARSIVESTLAHMLQGNHAMRGESLFSGRLNERVLNEKLSIVDDGLLENSLASAPFDDEGTPSRRNVIVESGILKTFIFDLYSSAEFGLHTTGNGIRAARLSPARTFRSMPTPQFRNFVILGEEWENDEILKTFAPCIVIYSVLGAHTANPVTGNFAVNIPIVFEYVDGELRARKQGMLSGNIADYLSREVVISKERKNCAGTYTPTNYAMPGILIPNAQITGT